MFTNFVVLRVYQKYRSVFPFFLFVFLFIGVLVQVNAQVVLPLDQKNSLTGDWLVYQEKSNQLVPYVASAHTDVNALHQWLSIMPSQSFSIGFTAPKDLCLFLNNRLVFKADSTATYKVDVSSLSDEVKPIKGKYLLTVWHPSQQPNVKGFYNEIKSIRKGVAADQRPLSIRVREYVNQNAFILFLLLLGLIYGWLKVNYPTDFNRLFNASFFSRTNRIDEGVLAKPIGSLSSILFVFAFSLSLALLIAAIHTNVQHIMLFNRLFPVSEADVTTRIGVYTFCIFGFILLKYLFLKVMAFIFGLEDVVQLQYAEFIKTILFLGIFLPFVMLLYLPMNASVPEVVLTVSNVLVSLLLIITILKVFVTVNKKAPVLNLHLFSYLCATEVIPLAIALKLIVFNF
ncbi:DUF4271 domain-containing protein [Pontibacter locisalis]|uniref:DUF4271 domain-containing protein n=1 Tax=Pontibacter locisalis TaxID=1719035 RepID=A0ABW5IJM3_9BACT